MFVTYFENQPLWLFWDGILSLCILMIFPIHFNTISMGQLIVYFKESHVKLYKWVMSIPGGWCNLSKQCSHWWNSALCCISSVSHCLPKYPFLFPVYMYNRQRGFRYMGHDARKFVFGGLRTTQAQTSLRIRVDWWAPLFFAFWKASYLNLLRSKFQFSSQSLWLSRLVCVSFFRKPRRQVLSRRGPFVGLVMPFISAFGFCE